VGEKNENDSPFPSCSLPFPETDDVLPSPMVLILSKEVDEPKEGDSIHYSTCHKGSPTHSPSVSNPYLFSLTD